MLSIRFYLNFATGFSMLEEKVFWKDIGTIHDQRRFWEVAYLRYAYDSNYIAKIWTDSFINFLYDWFNSGILGELLEIYTLLWNDDRYDEKWWEMHIVMKILKFILVEIFGNSI